MKCTFDGCTRDIHAAKYGLCRAHYMQQYLGRPLTPIRAYHKRKPSPEGHLHCRNCDRYKPEDEFYKRTNGKPQHMCKQCTIKAHRKNTLDRRKREQDV